MSPQKELLDKQLLRATALGYFLEVELIMSTPRIQSESKKPASANTRSLASVKTRDRLLGEDLLIRDLGLALAIGVQLKEDWVIINSAIYLYNY
jgi:hypothetical protein